MLFRSQSRSWLYYQQQTVSAEGLSGQAFSTFVPHTVRGKETKQCADCHVSDAKDNNAWMAQVLLQGTGFTNFLGRYVWVGEEDEGLEAVIQLHRLREVLALFCARMVGPPPVVPSFMSSDDDQFWSAPRVPPWSFMA